MPDGSIVWEGVLTDITAQKAAEAKIARSNAALRNMLDALPFAVGICAAGQSHHDPRTDIIFLNGRFISLPGYTIVDIPTVEEWAIKAYPDEDYRQEVFAWWNAAVKRITTGASTSEIRELRMRAKSGSTKEILLSTAPLEDKLIVAFQDMTEHREAEREQANRESQLEQSLGTLTERQQDIFLMIGRGMNSNPSWRPASSILSVVRARGAWM